MATKKMSDKEKRFVEAYCGEGKMVLARSARLAGFSGNNSVLSRQGRRMMRRPHVRRSIDRRLDRMSMTSGEVTMRLTNMARGSVAPFIQLDADGEPHVDLGTKTAQKNYDLIRKLRVKKRIIPQKDNSPIVERTVDIEIHDAKDAAIQMGKIRGLYVEKDSNGEAVGNTFKVYVGINPDEAL